MTYFACFRSMATSTNIADILKFNNRTLKKLPIDSNKDNYVRQVKDACFSIVKPSSVKEPRIVAYSKNALKMIGLPEKIVDSEINSLAPYLCGNKLFNGSEPAAHCYCGHQFGSFAGQLGDGATMYLGEVVNNAKEKWEIQFKGAGKTPYSRSADGRKVLRSSLREFLCSEAIHYLGIPTTRAGSIVTSDSWIERDMFYDGHPKMERCSVVLRIAETFIRFGSFEICKTMDPSTGRVGPSVGNNEILKTLLNFVIEEYYPDIWRDNKNKDDLYLKFFREIVIRTAKLVAKWQTVGFCHGVLNTDNMSIVGLTIDYGPFGFMDRYDPSFICNSSDNSGRYAYSQQPEICKWNCGKLAEALHKLIPLDQSKEIIKANFDSHFMEDYNEKMAQKIGFSTASAQTTELVTDLLDTMFKTGCDYTNTFLILEKYITNFFREEALEMLLKQCATLEELEKAFQPTLSAQDRHFFWMMAGNDRERLLAMGGEFVLSEDEKDKKLQVIKKMTEPEKASADRQIWLAWLIKYQTELTSYWKTDPTLNNRTNSLSYMKSSNPRIVLRNYIAQLAIDAAEKHGDFSVAQKLLDNYLSRPYSDHFEGLDILTTMSDTASSSIPNDYNDRGIGICTKPPSWASELLVS